MINYLKEEKLFGKYITFPMVEPILQQYVFENIICLGESVEGVPINLYQVGCGAKKILIWSQMHGNEPTTTKALFDVLKIMKKNEKFENLAIFFIPILNPDGAKAYTRVNANNVDLNRDAFIFSQPENQCLRKAYNLTNPDFCFNLHDQRTIFSAGKINNPATVSFLAPSFNEERDVNEVRKKSMEIISVMNTMLQKYIPNQVGRFDDAFNINCTGDFYTSSGTPTILFESGFYPNDYDREETRKYVALSIMEALIHINSTKITGNNYKSYFEIPENDKLFFDILLRDDFYENDNDIGILYEEKLENDIICFNPYIGKIGNLSNYYGHIEYKLSEIFTDKIDKKDIKKQLDLKKFKAK